MKSKYELALVLSGALDEDAKAAALEKVQGYITRFNGTVTNVDDWGKKKFAFTMKKENEGYYTFITFESDDSACPNEVEDNVRLMEQVIVYLIVKQEA